jgi:hypothetical protein
MSSAFSARLQTFDARRRERFDKSRVAEMTPVRALDLSCNSSPLAANIAVVRCRRLCRRLAKGLRYAHYSRTRARLPIVSRKASDVAGRLLCPSRFIARTFSSPNQSKGTKGMVTVTSIVVKIVPKLVIKEDRRLTTNDGITVGRARRNSFLPRHAAPRA